WSLAAAPAPRTAARSTAIGAPCPRGRSPQATEATMPAVDFDGERVDALVRALLERAPGERIVIETLPETHGAPSSRPLRDASGRPVAIVTQGALSVTADSVPDA